MKALIYSAHEYERPFLTHAAQGRHQLQLESRALSAATAELARGYEAVVIFTNDDASAPVLVQLQALGVRYVAVRAAGHDQVDSAAARRLGLRVSNVPNYSPYAVAEHTVGLMLALNRQLLRAQANMRHADFRLDQLVGFNLHGKTVGIIGCGKIGGVLAGILQGFGCKLLAYDLYPNPEFVQRYGLRYVPFEELCATSDIISLHVPLTPATHYLMNADTLAHCKPTAMLINTGRGGLLDTRAALAALRAGRLGYLGLDVYEFEKGRFFEDHSQDTAPDPLLEELLAEPNVVVTSHQAFLTNEALTDIFTTTMASLDAWAQGQPSEHEL